MMTNCLGYDNMYVKSLHYVIPLFVYLTAVSQPHSVKQGMMMMMMMNQDVCERKWPWPI